MRREWRCFIQGAFWNRGIANVTGYPVNPTIAPPGLITALPEQQGLSISCHGCSGETAGQTRRRCFLSVSDPCIPSCQVGRASKNERRVSEIGGRYRPTGVCLR